MNCIFCNKKVKNGIKILFQTVHLVCVDDYIKHHRYLFEKDKTKQAIQLMFSYVLLTRLLLRNLKNDTN